MVDDHLEISVAVLDRVDRQLGLAVLDFELGGDRRAVLLARRQALFERHLGVRDDRRELSPFLYRSSQRQQGLSTRQRRGPTPKRSGSKAS